MPTAHVGCASRARGAPELKEVIERILQAEQDAKRMVREARDEARRMVQDSHKSSQEIVEKAREDARLEGQEFLEKARQEAADRRQQILDDARTRAEVIVGGAKVEDSSIISRAVRGLTVPVGVVSMR